ncbi:hypothetical protein FKM82_028690 [Ascaphus truei]
MQFFWLACGSLSQTFLSVPVFTYFAEVAPILYSTLGIIWVVLIHSITLITVEQCITPLLLHVIKQQNTHTGLYLLSMA